jgi:hypothetical protein
MTTIMNCLMRRRRSMNRKAIVLGSLGIMLAGLVFAATLVLPAGVLAQAKVVPVEGVGYNVNASMKDNLKSLTGKSVYVTLDSGKTLTGTVKEVGEHLVHLEKLEGKEYFDALIVIQHINAIDTRFRNVER